MATIKISALPSATLPLAGTEQIVLVQSGATVGATVADCVIPPSNNSADIGTAVLSWRGVYAYSFYLEQGSFEITVSATTLTANRAITLPDVSGQLLINANNLSDVSNAGTARTNLGATATGGSLFTAASAAAARAALGSTTVGDAVFIAAAASDGRTALGVTATGADTTYCYRANNLSDVTASSARSNLDVTATGADTTYNYRVNNLSDVANVVTARTNLGVPSTAHFASSADYQDIYGGIRIQWGRTGCTIGTGGSVTFPTGFTAIYSVVASLEYGGSSGYVMNHFNPTTTGFDYGWNFWAGAGSGSGAVIDWIAIGAQ